MAIPLGNQELATTLWSLQQALCYIMLWCFIWASAQVQSNRVFWALDTSLLLLTTSHIFQCNPPSFDDFDLDNKHLPRDIGSFMVSLGQHFLPPFLGIPPTVRPRGWWHHVDLSSSKSIPPMLDGICRPSWSKLLSWYWAKSHLSNMDSGLIVLQHAVPSTKRSGISQLSKLLWGQKVSRAEICSFVPSTKLASGNSACKASFNTPASMNKAASRDSFVLKRYLLNSIRSGSGKSL